MADGEANIGEMSGWLAESGRSCMNVEREGSMPDDWEAREARRDDGVESAVGVVEEGSFGLRAFMMVSIVCRGRSASQELSHSDVGLKPVRLV